MSATGGRRWGLAVLLGCFFACGALLVGVGVHSYGVESQIARQGVPVQATVVDTSGRGTIALEWTTSSGRAYQGSVSDVTPSDYRDGQTVSALYDPARPGVVALASASHSHSSAWWAIAGGALFLAMVPAALALDRYNERYKARRQAEVDALRAARRQ